VVTEAVERLRRIEESVQHVLDVLEEDEDSSFTGLIDAGNELKATLDSVGARFMTPEGQRPSPDDPPVSRLLQRVYGSLESSWDAPTQAQRLSLDRADAVLRRALAELRRVFAEDVEEFRRAVSEAGLQLMPEIEALGIDWTPEG
jgi:hypothetical protein